MTENESAFVVRVDVTKSSFVTEGILARDASISELMGHIDDISQRMLSTTEVMWSGIPSDVMSMPGVLGISGLSDSFQSIIQDQMLAQNASMSGLMGHIDDISQRMLSATEVMWS